jgi:hypothetical protein
MACGDEHAKILLRAADNRDADSPCGGGVWCGSADVAAWGAQEQHVFNLVRKAWNALKAEEHKTADYHRSDELHSSVQAYEEAHAALPDEDEYLGVSYAFGGFGNAEEAIQAFLNSISRGACQLELLEAALADAGGKPIYTGPGLPGHKAKADKLLPYGVVALGIAAAALLLTRK